VVHAELLEGAIGADQEREDRRRRDPSPPGNPHGPSSCRANLFDKENRLIFDKENRLIFDKENRLIFDKENRLIGYRQIQC